MVQHLIADELRGKARALGLDRLTNKHFEQFERATTGMERHLKRLPRDMLPAQEPAQHLSSEEVNVVSGDFAYLGLAEAAELIRDKILSLVEYATVLLARIERHDPKLNAFIALMPDRALAAARAAEAEITADRWRGPFHGLPYAQGHHRCRGDRDDGAFADPGRKTAPALMPRSPSGSKPLAGSCWQTLDP